VGQTMHANISCFFCLICIPTPSPAPPSLPPQNNPQLNTNQARFFLTSTC